MESINYSENENKKLNSETMEIATLKIETKNTINSEYKNKE